ncbi:MAG: Recombination protein RecR [Chlamydiae bacterium]|nr:Recombination protein RecR [Chlamydiota bacterium]
MTKYPLHLNSIIDFFKMLPGVGQRSAERYAFQILDWPQKNLQNFGEALKKIPTEIQFCNKCHAMAPKTSCFYCDDPKRSKEQICIVATPKDIFSIEDSLTYSGQYHVLGGLLSPMSGFNSDKLNISSLKSRLGELKICEVILAFDSTVEGDATTLFLKRELSSDQIKVSRLAFGIPVGSSLDYIDSSTLSRAFSGRQGF